MYATVKTDGDKFAIQNLADGMLLKSKESGAIIAFSDEEKANNVRDFFQEHYDAIKNASREWLVKEGGQMRKIFVD